MFQIMIIEDDPKIEQLLCSHIEKYGYRAMPVQDFSKILDEFHSLLPDLVLLDINLPYFDGYYWCRQIRKTSICPILFITAREGKMDQVMALENGADDYITKPFDYEIVMAKIKSHLRRSYGQYAQKGERTIEVAGLILYPERMQLTLAEKIVELSHKESILLQTLMEFYPRVVRRDRLLEKLWDDQHFIDDNTLNVYVTRVRKKLLELSLKDVIETVRGAGYRLSVTWRETE
ncbi:two-component system, OmpR family, response regulator YxdJ [Seinonella peptonophila]|uniref:Two-component system, OmpR family, response regulator YxdJ n=1 Tax=Seinonella peptonophila TaxID=112248 RepID=A0A1M4W6A0_9BACL|nr:response regulator transcription factor [Seinonella peptonophila]SHE76623.1 two-component system, OmpR family, response regulator YxdJ [Seinonella peptonophila]